jgi:hypothetical protein
VTTRPRVPQTALAKSTPVNGSGRRPDDSESIVDLFLEIRNNDKGDHAAEKGLSAARGSDGALRR